MKEEEKAYYHWLAQAVGVGNKRFLRALTEFGTPQEIFTQALSGKLADRLSERFREKAALLSETSRLFDVQGEYERLTARGIRFVMQEEDAYPGRLFQKIGRAHV